MRMQRARGRGRAWVMVIRERIMAMAAGRMLTSTAEEATPSMAIKMLAAHSSGRRSMACAASQESITASARPACTASIISSTAACCSAYKLFSSFTTCRMRAPAAPVRGRAQR